MASIQDDRGFNQGFKPSLALTIRTSRRCEYILKKAQVIESGRILEIGCGTGEISYLLAKQGNIEVLGTDICRPFVDQAKVNYKHPKLNYSVFDFNTTTENDFLRIGKFDSIVGNGILHHLYHQLDTALQRLKELCKPGGRIVFLEPNLINPYCFLIFTYGPLRRLAKLEPDEMAFTRSFIIKKLENNGFRDICVEYKDFLLPNTPAPLIRPTIRLGEVLDKIPGLNRIAQSLFISAKAP